MNMAKTKASKDGGKIPNKAVHSRVSYLYQAAAYFATQQHSTTVAEHEYLGSSATEGVSPKSHDDLAQPMSRRLILDFRSVSLKMQTRLSPAMKHSICKSCDTMLIDGSTCFSEVENKSKDGKKPWADVLVRRCKTCGFERRYPLAAERQKRRPDRVPRLESSSSNSKVG